MASSIKFKVDTAKFGREVQLLANAAKRTVAEVVRDQSRLLVRDLVKSTPPHGSRPIMEDWTFQRRKGEQTIALDVNRLFVDVKSIRAIMRPTGKAHHGRNLKRDYLKTLLEQGRYDRVKEALFAMHVTGTRIPIIDTLSKKIYRDQWTKFQKRGRIPKGTNSDILVSNSTSVKEVIAQIAKRVGYAKAGWLKAAKALKTQRLPEWVTRHSSAPGSFEDLTKDTAQPYFSMTNEVPYIGYLNSGGRLVQRAMRNRQRAMEIQTEYAIEAFLKKFSDK